MSNPPTIALLTEERYENPTPGHWYVDNILHEDRLIIEALSRRGVQAQRVAWSRADVDWSAYDLAVFRTTWDYFDRFVEFTAWLERVQTQTRIINDPAVIRWNADKRYLADLERAGVHTVPTAFLPRGEPVRLAEFMNRPGWEGAVLKPVVSGGARNTYRITRDTIAEHESRLAELVATETMMLQPFQRFIVEQGEITLVVIDGRTTHAVRKVAKPGDFRVQDDHGGTLHDHDPSPEEIEFAERAMATCDPAAIYGRVDMVRDNDGALAVMELELIEPELWFRRCPAAADRMAEALAGALRRP